MWGHALEVITGLVYVVWIASIHSRRSPTAFMSELWLPIALLVAYGAIITVSYVAADDPYIWPLDVVRVIAGIFALAMVLRMVTMYVGPLRRKETEAASESVSAPSSAVSRSSGWRKPPVSTGSAYGDELLARQRRAAA